jgi:hypothetical protein
MSREQHKLDRETNAARERLIQQLRELSRAFRD